MEDMAIQKIKLKIGTVYQKEPNGVYYFRYQVNGARKAISLKTRNKQQAIKEAEKHVPLLQATSSEVIAAHVQHARNLATPEKNLLLYQAWEEYEKSPDRATPDTVSEALAYKATFAEFTAWVNDPQATLRDITETTAIQYADFMRQQNIAVSTHNRKLKRIRKVFAVLKEYRSGDNPFTSPVLFRKEREEREQDIHRLSFTREQEQQLRDVLDDDRFKVLNKPEVKVVYYLGMFTGQRMKDCVLLRWSKVNLEIDRIWVKQFKTGKEVTLPIAPKLREVLLEALSWKSSELDYVCPNVAVRYNKVNKAGKNIGNNLVNIDMLRVIRWIGLEPSVTVPGRDKKVTVYGFHSLRHSFASYCAEAGVAQATVVSILGADSEVVTKYYTHVGDEAQRQAIAAVSGINPVSPAQRKVDEALAQKYSEALYDSFASSYDKVMEKLESKSLAEILNALPQRKWNHVLDAACGTGTFALKFEQEYDSLTGVDISKNMLMEADKTFKYTRLVHQDISSFLQEDKEEYSLIVASDVIGYLPQVDQLFKAVYAKLEEKGIFAFTFETNDLLKEGELQPSGRMVYPTAPLKDLLLKQNFKIEVQKEFLMRKEGTSFAKGMLFVVSK